MNWITGKSKDRGFSGTLKSFMSAHYTIGLDYGTNSVRALIVDVKNGREVGTSVWDYEHGAQGIIEYSLNKLIL